MLKFAFPLLFILTSCSSTSVLLSHPIPSGKKDLSDFRADFQGTYLVSDTVLHTDFFDASNARYSPEIYLPEDTSVFFLFSARIHLQEKRVVRSYSYQAYMRDSLFRTLSQKDKSEVDSIVQYQGYVGLFFPHELDTLFDLEQGDLLRFVSGNTYVVNRASEGAFTPIFLARDGEEGLRCYEFDREAVIKYFKNSRKQRCNNKGLLIEEDNPIQLSNREYKKIARKRLFKHWFFLQRTNE